MEETGFRIEIGWDQLVIAKQKWQLYLVFLDTRTIGSVWNGYIILISIQPSLQ